LGRGGLAWVLAGVGVILVIVVAAAIGGRDRSDETVPAADWALGAKSGVLISAAVVLVVSNTVNLSAIASVGSAFSLMTFVLVGVAGYRLRSATGASAAIILVGIAATLVVLAFFAVDTFRNAPQTFTAIVVIAVLAVALDLVWKRARGPLPDAPAEAEAAPGS
jgi:hypothetical protein